jgi:hypothetical protein
MGIEPVYITRDPIVDALSVKPTTYQLSEVDRACRAGSRSVEGCLKRIFYPEVRTRYFDWPSSRFYSTPARIDFDKHALISATTVVSDGVTITDYFLEPDDDGPPYEHLDLDRDSSAVFAGGPQRAIAVTGLWGWTNDEQTIGALSGAINSTDTLITLSVPAPVGTILRIGTERLQVIGIRWIDSTITASALTNSKADVSIAVSSGALFTENEVLLIESERVRVTEIAGNVLTVKRADGGTVIAAHSAATAIYWQHRIQVERGSLGTTAASALDAAVVYRWVPPSLVSELAQAYVEDYFLQRNAGYARTTGSGESEQQVNGRGVAQIEKRARAVFRRGARHYAI